MHCQFIYILLSKLIVISHFIKYTSDTIKWLCPIRSRLNLGLRLPEEALTPGSIYQGVRQKSTLKKLVTSLGLVMKAQFL